MSYDVFIYPVASIEPQARTREGQFLQFELLAMEDPIQKRYGKLYDQGVDDHKIFDSVRRDQFLEVYAPDHALQRVHILEGARIEPVFQPDMDLVDMTDPEVRR